MTVANSIAWLRNALFTFWLPLAATSIFVPHAEAQMGGEWRASERHLWRISPDGTGRRPFCDCTGYRCGSPVWSPDGKFVACDASLVSQSSSGTEIVVIRADGSGFHSIGAGCIPSWSRDSQLIVADAGGTVIMNVDGSGRESVFWDSGGFPRWSRRDDRIVYLNADRITLTDPATGGMERLVMRPSSPFREAVRHGWDISSDGRRICFAVGEKLLLATFDETMKQTSVRVLVDAGNLSYHTSWVPDGRHIAFTWQSKPDEPIQIYTIDVDSDEPPRLLPGLDTTHANVNPAWSPDGETIIFSVPAPITDLGSLK